MPVRLTGLRDYLTTMAGSITLERQRETPIREQSAVDVGLDLPPTMDLPEWSWLLRLARRAEGSSGLTGLGSFLLAKAKQASDGVPTAIDDGELGAEIFGSHQRETSYQLYFRANPWWPGELEHERGPGLEARWSFLGGWFGLSPIVALATADGAGRRHDPSYVFMPQFAVAYATDLVIRLTAGLDSPTWTDLWARWSRVLPTITTPSQAEGSFEDFLRRTHRCGADPDIAGRPVSTRRYPGFRRVAQELQADAAWPLTVASSKAR